jgi:hypothetical protein
LTTGVEAGVAVVKVGGSSLTDNNGAQHEGGRVTHFEMSSGYTICDTGIYMTGKVVTSFNGVSWSVGG